MLEGESSRVSKKEVAADGKALQSKISAPVPVLSKLAIVILMTVK